MRKETIIKYEKEFLAWCKGDSVLLGAPTSMHDRTLIWREVRDFNDWKPLDTVYVLNDSYYIYRKALAEGKIIQLNEAEKFSDQNRGWVDLSCTSLGSSTNLFPVEYYRIKPEEPKFKVGDWVVHKSKGVCKIEKIPPSNEPDDKNVWLGNKGACFINELELWGPKTDEFCWFWNFTDMPTLEQFSKYHDLDDHLGNYETLTTKLYYYCEPFIGQLPSYLKE